ncbi:MAG: hypothetical protein ACXV2F_03265 [Halobacteriota archaeon]
MHLKSPKKRERVNLWSYVDERIDGKKSSLRRAYPTIFSGRDTSPRFSIDTACGVLRPKFNDWSMIPEGCRVIINTFAPESDVLAPCVTAADPLIRDVDEVLASGPGAAVTTGRAACPGTR